MRSMILYPRFSLTSSIFFCLTLFSIFGFISACQRDDGNENEVEEEILVPTPTPLPTNTPFPTPEEPTPTPTITPLPTPTTPPAWFEGLFVQVPNSLGEAQSIEEVEGQDDAALPPHHRFPTHEQIILNNWPINTTDTLPRILAFPARDYAGMNVQAQHEIKQLSQYLNATNQISEPRSLPFIPIQQQPQAFVAQAALLPFQSGDGLRYITWFPDQFSISSEVRLLYTWQGITNDGRGVVSAILPISLPNLPAPPETDSLESFENWTAEIEAQLNQSAPDAFTPSLTSLDRMVSSIYALLPEPELIFDEDGIVDLTIVYPPNGGHSIIGSTMVVEGYLQPGANRQVELQLFSGDHPIASEIVLSRLDGWFTASLNIPLHVQGEATLTAFSAGQSAEIVQNLIENPAVQSDFVTLLRPIPNDIAYAGYPIYIEGLIDGPLVEETLTVALLTNGCKTQVANQSIPILPTDTAWQTIIQPPADMQGDACLSVSTGSFGEDSWREIQHPILLQKDPPTSPNIILGNSTLFPLKSGATVLIHGLAFGSPSDGILITAMSDTGVHLSESTVIVEDNRWQTSITVPSDSSGRLFFEISLVGDAASNSLFSLPVQAK